MVVRAEDILYGRNGMVVLAPPPETYTEAMADVDIAIRNLTLATAHTIEARVRVQSTDIMLPRDFSTRRRRTGWNGEGTMRIYRVKSEFFNTMANMIDLKKQVPVFNVIMDLINDDPGASTSYQEKITLEQVKFWDFDWMFNMTDFVELPLRFTFEGIKNNQPDKDSYP